MINVAVLRGGPSPEYGVSLKTGETFLRHLQQEPLVNKYAAHDILVDRNGVMHYRGLPISFERLSQMVGVVINALHGAYGEDGKLQQELERYGIPYTGSGPFASALGMHKVLAKNQFNQNEIKTPKFIVVPDWRTADTSLSRNDYMKEFTAKTFQKMPPHWIVKPVASGSSDRVSLAKTLPDLHAILMFLSQDEGDLLIEEYIDGREVSVNIVEGLRGEKFYNTPLVEIRKPKDTVFGYSHKYEEPISRTLGKFTKEEKENIINTATNVHKALGLSQYSQSDMVLHPRRGLYVLEVNTLPGLTENSLLPYGLDSVGVGMPEFIDHLINTASLKGNG